MDYFLALAFMNAMQNTHAPTEAEIKKFYLFAFDLIGAHYEGMTLLVKNPLASCLLKIVRTQIEGAEMPRV